MVRDQSILFPQCMYTLRPIQRYFINASELLNVLQIESPPVCLFLIGIAKIRSNPNQTLPNENSRHELHSAIQMKILWVIREL